MPRTIAVLGRSIGGQLAACYLKKKLPHLRVVLVGPESNTLPVVGESTIEATTFFLQELGLLGYLSEQQLHKTGLTFYFKKHLDDPRDRCYAVHEQPATPPLPSFQLNRFSFAVALEELCARLGVERRDGRARSITQHGRARFRIAITGAGDESLAAHWVLDCTGRARFLARRYGLQRRAPVQRCSFWLRLSGFDRDFLSRISAEKPRQCSYDSYFATHHFFGKGNWIWVIPLKGDQGRLVSIGITWRPDLFPGTVRSVEDFIAQAEREHPVVAELLRSGKVEDTQLYLNYMYRSARVYSPEGWFVVGDAGNTVDPLYSSGLAFTTLQIQQITEMIRRDDAGRLTSAFVRDLETMYFRPRQQNSWVIGGSGSAPRLWYRAVSATS